jgi:hypothetical protein
MAGKEPARRRSVSNRIRAINLNLAILGDLSEGIGATPGFNSPSGIPTYSP